MGFRHHAHRLLMSRLARSATAADSNGDSNNSDQRQAAATGDSASRSQDSRQLGIVDVFFEREQQRASSYESEGPYASRARKERKQCSNQTGLRQTLG